MACAESGGVLKDAIFDDVLALKQPTAMWPRPAAVGAPNARGNVLRQQRLRSVLCQASQFHLLCIAPSIRKDPMTICWLNIFAAATSWDWHRSSLICMLLIGVSLNLVQGRTAEQGHCSSAECSQRGDMGRVGSSRCVLGTRRS